MPTPVFNIPFPTGATKLRNLGPELEGMALGVEAALLAAGTNPATTTAIVTAPSAAARDLHWGVPATAAARRTLQDSGATTLRTDKGWTERYYAAITDGGSNPGGVPVPGWYPVGGALPVAKVAGASAVLTAPFASISFPTEVFDATEMHSPGSSRFTVPVAGLYRLIGKYRTVPTPLTVLRFAVNGVGLVESEAYVIAGTGAYNDQQGTALVRLATADYVELQIASNPAGPSLHPTHTAFSVEYVAPPVGA